MFNQKAFTLIEILIYIAILSIVAVLFTGILSTGTRVQLQETAANEVSNQLNFAIQTIQRLVRDSSAIIVTNASTCTSAGDVDTVPGTAQPCLKLRMHDDGQAGGRDPIFVWADSNLGKIQMKQGNGAISDLTTNKVVVPSDGLKFTKLINYPGHDAVQISLTLNYNTANVQSQVSRSITTAVGRVSAATFDSKLLGNGTAGVLDIGSGYPDNKFWNNLYLNNDFSIVDGKIYEPANYDSANPNRVKRGQMLVGAKADPAGATCNSVCSYHTGHCDREFVLEADPLNAGRISADSTTCDVPATSGLLCFCD